MNPEELLLAALPACHELWYLHLCSQADVVVVDYVDRAEDTMVEEADGAGQFTTIVLRPRVTPARGSDPDLAVALHARASRMCFVERSLSCRVSHEPVVAMEGAASVPDQYSPDPTT